MFQHGNYSNRKKKVINQNAFWNILWNYQVHLLKQSKENFFTGFRCYLMTFLALGFVEARHLSKQFTQHSYYFSLRAVVAINGCTEVTICTYNIPVCPHHWSPSHLQLFTCSFLLECSLINSFSSFSDPDNDNLGNRFWHYFLVSLLGTKTMELVCGERGFHHADFHVPEKVSLLDITSKLNTL